MLHDMKKACSSLLAPCTILCISAIIYINVTASQYSAVFKCSLSMQIQNLGLSAEPGFVTYLGGSSSEGVALSAFDENGRICLTGGTSSDDFPIVGYSHQSTNAGDYDLYFTLLTSDGRNIVFSTYLGGSDRDVPIGISIDKQQNVIIAGTTYSPDFPISDDAIEKGFNGSAMGFIAKFDTSGRLIFSTYIGGNRHDQIFAMAVDDEGNIYVTGLTESQNLPVSPGALQSGFRGGSNDSFVMKIDSSGSQILYCTYFGATGYDEAYTIKVNANKEAVIAGATNSQNLRTTPGVIFEDAPWGGEDGFIAKVSADGKRLLKCTYLGGQRNWDLIEAIDIDDNDNIYCTGRTLSVDFPVTTGVIQPEFPYNQTQIAYSAFVVKINAAMDSLLLSTYFGGTNTDYPRNIFVFRDAIVLIGSTKSDDILISADAFQKSLLGEYDLYLSILNQDASRLLFSTYFGGSGFDAGRGAICGYDSSIFLGVNTQSLDFPVTPNALQPQYGGGTSDAGVVKISLNSIITSATSPPQTPTSLTLLQSYPNPVAGSGMVTVPYTVAARGSGTVAIYNSTGQQVYSRKVSHNTAGQYTLTAMLPSLPAGLYFYTLSYSGTQQTRKMIVE